jgi:hypothetical protein
MALNHCILAVTYQFVLHFLRVTSSKFGDMENNGNSVADQPILSWHMASA